LSKTKLAVDGDLLLQGDRADEPSQTELAIRKLSARLELDDRQIHRDLQREKEFEFEETRLYQRIFELADENTPSPAPRAMVPNIRLQSVKISRKLTTDWFAQRVDGRYRKCLGN
jgi:hypothetical protein